MPEVYRAHDLLLFPSLHDSGGQVVLEALAHGLPVVCFDLGGPGSIVDAGCGRAVRTTGRSRSEVLEGLTATLQELADAPQLRQRLGQDAQTRARQYEWRRQIAGVYEEIESAVVDPLPGERRSDASELD